jgi:hypothetical protein
MVSFVLSGNVNRVIILVGVVVVFSLSVMLRLRDGGCNDYYSNLI